ncbi:Rubredoxin [Methylomagnum ishizawai]|uniref:Rubredoxin n=1 Tax=Methylomagnum ishizawai TaxID=1760988 RepID=A0A1Y6D557_9GAMM|nr:rubredoxin [Methylomagnum ishizawai]SMF97736.1 Rubredoxin [Methylomagnum ishizawai]
MFENYAPGPGLPPGARLECGICWWVYDPAAGDPAQQVEPGTPFAQLPPDWRCPQCDAPPQKFMVVANGV